jgi:ribosomal protein S18 acetylase RimI-like enzyme
LVEIGVTIDPFFRRRGLGRRLVAEALTFAFGRGAKLAQFFFDPSNRALMGLVNSLGGRIVMLGCAEIFYTPDSVAREAA